MNSTFSRSRSGRLYFCRSKQVPKGRQIIDGGKRRRVAASTAPGAMNARNAERGTRAEERATGSVPELRKATAELILAAARMVNALNMVTPTDDTASAIKSVYGIVEQYKLIAAHHGKKSDGSDDTPDPSPDGSDETTAS